jgi:biotin carboxylase
VTERLLLLLPTTTYRTQAFLDAARALDVELDIVCGSERASTLESLAPDGLLTLDFSDPARAASVAAQFHARRPITAVVAVDDLTTVAAAAISERLGIPSNSVRATTTARHKLAQRSCLRAAGVPVPRFWPIGLGDDLEAAARKVAYPCVLKPLTLSASRGVIRANDPGEFVAAARRIADILSREPNAVSGLIAPTLLCESFIPGVEVALEGLMSRGTLHTLALFDKPDPLDGPFFEETLYVTPSRLPDATQRAIAATTACAASALGLHDGPIHAELRVNDTGPWILEVAARSIGGLCSRSLRFGDGVSLEEIILRQALGRRIDSLDREGQASGVMMIPIPRAGRLRSVSGEEDAERVPHVEEVAITIHVEQEVVPLPEGSQYLGFIFARADTAAEVEAALRQAHSYLFFDIA